MKKRRFGKQLSRSRKSHRALRRSLVRAIVSHGAIKTTITKAKVVQPEVEKMASLAKEGSLSARRRVYARLGNDRKTTDKLFGDIAKVFSDTKSGFTRIVRLPQRRGDNAQMARLEWVKNINPEEKGIGKKAVARKKKKSETQKEKNKEDKKNLKK